MDELTMLRKIVEEHDYKAALAIIDELDEMAKEKFGRYRIRKSI